MKERCLSYSYLHSSFKYFLKFAFARETSPNSQGFLAVAVRMSSGNLSAPSTPHSFFAVYVQGSINREMDGLSVILPSLFIVVMVTQNISRYVSALYFNPFSQFKDILPLPSWDPYSIFSLCGHFEYILLTLFIFQLPC